MILENDIVDIMKIAKGDRPVIDIIVPFIDAVGFAWHSLTHGFRA